MENSKIEWTHHTFNPWIGCTKVSAGCTNCYAEADMDKRRKRAQWGPHGTRTMTTHQYWQKPFAWDRAAKRDGVRCRVFCASLADVFEQTNIQVTSWDGKELWFPRNWKGCVYEPGARHYFMQYEIDTLFDQPHESFLPTTLQDLRIDLFRLISLTPNLDWLVLTKRPQEVRPFYDWISGNERRWVLGLDGHANIGAQWPPENVWIGTSVEDQETADERIDALLRITAAVRFVSYEPALGPVDFSRFVFDREAEIRKLMYGAMACNRDQADSMVSESLDWVIVGGESGPGARAFDLAWARSTVKQCKAAGVACFVKQLGACPFDSFYRSGVTDQRFYLRDKKGGDMEEWPPELRVRQFPRVESLVRESR